MNTNISKNNKQRILYLDVARFIAIISISLNHAVNRSYDNAVDQQLEFLSSSFGSTAFKAFVSVVSRVGVPLFLMITGVLILNKTMEKESDFKRFYKHNFLSLFITTELWLFIMFWVNVIYCPYFPYNQIWHVYGLRETIKALFETLTFQNQVTFGSMWYMPMILGMYLTLPLLCVVKDKVPKWVIYIPMAAVFFNSFVLKTLNEFITLTGRVPLESSVEEQYIFSIYYVYLLFGYFIGKGMLKKLKTWHVSVLTILTFGINWATQIYMYSSAENILIDYYSLGNLINAIFLFELIRRTQGKFEWCKKPICYISKESFAIYFIHIIIMSLMTWNIEFNLPKSAVLIILEVSSFVGSMLIIEILKRFKFCKKYLLSIKD